MSHSSWVLLRACRMEEPHKVCEKAGKWYDEVKCSEFRQDISKHGGVHRPVIIVNF